MTEPTAALAGFASRVDAAALPPEVRQSVKTLALDAFACALAGHRGEEVGQVTALAEALAPAGESRVIGGGRLSLAGATILNGYLITAVTMCDVYRPVLTHVTPAVVPPALAVAERDRVPGSALLAALAAGFETTVRVGAGLDPAAFRAAGWHGPGVIGPFGAAAAVGRLRGFGPDRMARAFGLAGSQSGGTFAAWGTPTVKWHQSRAALSGLMAALLAEQDFVATGAFLSVGDGGLYATWAGGGRPERVADGLGERWELRRIALRRWPGATALQEIVTALSGLDPELRFDDIDRVRIAASRAAFDMHGGFAAYDGKFEALLSAHYVTAAFLRDRSLDLDRFDPACYDDPALRAFAAGRVEIAPGLAPGEAAVEVVLRDGTTLSARCAHALGVPENPLSWSDIEDKFRACAAAALPPDRVDAVVRAVAELETLEDAGALAGLLGAV